MIAVLLPIKTVSEANQRGHWAKKAKRAKEQRFAAGLALRGPCRRAWLTDADEQLVVTLIRLAPSSGLDDDNLASALKATRDGVADALNVNDRNPRVAWRYAQARSKTYAVRVEIAPAQ